MQQNGGNVWFLWSFSKTTQTSKVWKEAQFWSKSDFSTAVCKVVAQKRVQKSFTWLNFVNDFEEKFDANLCNKIVENTWLFRSLSKTIKTSQEKKETSFWSTSGLSTAVCKVVAQKRVQKRFIWLNFVNLFEESFDGNATKWWKMLDFCEVFPKQYKPQKSEKTPSFGQRVVCPQPFVR